MSHVTEFTTDLFGHGKVIVDAYFVISHRSDNSPPDMLPVFP